MSHAATYAAAARSFVGVKWRHGGRTTRALDCIGLLIAAAARCGFTVEDEIGYGREPWDDRLRHGLARRFGQHLPPGEAMEGDIALIAWGAAEPMHVGVVARHPDGGLSLVHAHRTFGVIEQGLRGTVRASVVEVYRPDWSRYVD